MFRSPALLPIVLILAFATIARAQDQDPSIPDPNYRAPRTADQTPDISGLWRNDTLTPLERPTALGDQAYLSGEEAAAIQTRAEQARTRDNTPGIQRSPGERPSERVNDFWYDPRETVVHTRRTSMISDPPSGRAPTRPAAEDRAQWLVANRTTSHETMSPYTRCITRGMPGSMIPNAYNTGNHIFQIPGYVIILYEMVREPRIIPLDGRPSVDPKIRQWMGDTRGRWEGETLVVETTNFTEKGWITPNQNAGRMHGVPVSRELKLIERFTRLSDDILDWQVRIEDPDTYTEPWTLELPLRHDMNYTVYEYACHEGNRAVTNILSTARQLER
ncbi:MAG: hypothetical protein VB674_07025 [Vicinamibacterales bacterium]